MKKGDDSKHNIYTMLMVLFKLVVHRYIWKNYDDINILMDKCISTE